VESIFHLPFTDFDTTNKRSTHVGHPLLGLRLRGIFRPRGKLKHRCILADRNVRQQQRVAIREFERIVMRVFLFLIDLPEYGRVIADFPSFPTPEIPMRNRESFRKGDLRPRQDTNRDAGRFWCRESASPSPKIPRNKPVRYFG